MPATQEGTICLAQRAGLLLWVTAQVMSASGLAGQAEARYGAWKPEAEARSMGDLPVQAFAPAAGVETLNSTLLSAAKPETPVELWPDARPWAVHLTPRRNRDPLPGVLPPAWVLLGAASLFLATVDNRHRRRRTHVGCRHAAEMVVTKRKPLPAPWAGAGRGCDSTCDLHTAH